ncbi:hypothetical protein [Bacillus sp. 123MFChir2]|uniref:hypothetical protein n=1 Tax=Bacillus sp. 123MFChir2 TaxID=1169144 RepID=UPI000379514A|nr:hypothetical protein [Bacillus sp. 123MFChir2]
MEENVNGSPYINTEQGVYHSAKLQQAIDQAFRIPVFLIYFRKNFPSSRNEKGIFFSQTEFM